MRSFFAAVLCSTRGEKVRGEGAAGARLRVSESSLARSGVRDLHEKNRWALARPLKRWVSEVAPGLLKLLLG